MRNLSSTLDIKALFFAIEANSYNSYKYTSEYYALDSLIAFCKTASLPRPIVVKSGGDLHVYWPLVIQPPSDDLLHLAKQLHSAARGFGVKITSALITDLPSALCMQQTFNRKDQNSQRPVQILMSGTATKTSDIADKIIDAVIRFGDLSLLEKKVKLAKSATKPAVMMKDSDDILSAAKEMAVLREYDRLAKNVFADLPEDVADLLASWEG